MFQKKNEAPSDMLPDQLAMMREVIENDFKEDPNQVKDEFFVSGGEALLSKVVGMLIAKAYLPSGGHIKEALHYMDLAAKIELVLVRT